MPAKKKSRRSTAQLGADKARARLASGWRGMHAHNLVLSEHVVESMCAHIRAGLSVRSAAALAGVSYVSVQRWRARATAWELNDGEDAADLIYAAAGAAFDRAEAEYELALVRQLHAARGSSHAFRGPLSVLSRRFRADWSERDRERIEDTEFSYIADERYL